MKLRFLYQNIYKRANIKIIHCIVTRPVSVLISSLMTFLCLVLVSQWCAGLHRLQGGPEQVWENSQRCGVDGRVDLERKHREVMLTALAAWIISYMAHALH